MSHKTCQDVGRLDVLMHDVVRVKIVEARTALLCDIQLRVFRNILRVTNADMCSTLSFCKMRTVHAHKIWSRIVCTNLPDS